MPHVTGHFCVCHVELWLLFHDFFPVPGYLFLDLDLGIWVPGYLGNQGTREPVPWFPLYGSREPQGEPHGNQGTGSREPVPWFPPYGSREPVPGSPVPGSEMTGSPKFWFQYEYFPKIFFGKYSYWNQNFGEPVISEPGTGEPVPGNHTGGTRELVPGTSSLVPVWFPLWFPCGSREPGNRFPGTGSREPVPWFP